MAEHFSKKQIIAIKRKRGELDLSISALARETGLSRRTIYNIFTKKAWPVSSTTYKKISDWLINEYATADIKDSQSVVNHK